MGWGAQSADERTQSASLLQLATYCDGLLLSSCFFALSSLHF